MPNISNIPDDMVIEHCNWHTQEGSPECGGRRIDPWPQGSLEAAAGSGEEFLVWHAGYLRRFQQWVISLSEDQRPERSSIEPWTIIPRGFKMGMVGWNPDHARDEQRLQNMSSFGSVDELGRFLEWGLHGFLHGAAAAMFNERVIVTFESPRSTYFWQLHGLIEHWHQQWIVQKNVDARRVE